MTFGLYFFCEPHLDDCRKCPSISRNITPTAGRIPPLRHSRFRQAKPSQILKTSRFLVKGYKFQRFVLDLQLLPLVLPQLDYFLELLVFQSFPISKTIISSFYRALLARKRRNG